MADKYGRGPKTQFTMRASVGGFVVPGEPDIEVVPYRINSFDMDPWHVQNGWPLPGAGPTREVDVYDITPDPEVFPTPDSITTNADARWIAGDFSGGSWSAHAGTGTWSGTGTAKPSYTYKYDGVSYDVPGVRLNSEDGDYLSADLSAIAGNRYSIVMVFKPYANNNSDDDTDAAATYGLIAPAAAATGQPSLHVRNDKLFIKQSSELEPRQASEAAGTDRSFQHYIRRGAPSYLAWVIGANRFHFYLGDGPSTMERRGLGDPHDLPKIFNFVLGAYTDTTHTADVMLFDIGFYNDVLTGLQVANEVSLLAPAYGGK